MSIFIISMKSDVSQCLRGNESKLFAKSLHWEIDKKILFISLTNINVQLCNYAYPNKGNLYTEHD
ncbi:hypothetical protein EXW29_28305 (plasmid) [Bacillus toyonensis]|nr:hypothetical protein EXW29_28305 [Bacillus toyonensis]